MYVYFIEQVFPSKSVIFAMADSALAILAKYFPSLASHVRASIMFIPSGSPSVVVFLSKTKQQLMPLSFAFKAHHMCFGESPRAVR
jgi:hypothetical protein